MRLQTGLYADTSWQVRLRNFRETVGEDYGYVEASHLNRDRMSFQVQMPGMSADMRTVVRPVEDRRRRSRRDQLEQELRETREREARLISHDGVRASLAVLAVVMLAALLLLYWTVDGAALRAVQRRIDRLDYRMSELNRTYEENQQLLDQKVAGLDVGYAAVSQGLISSKGTRPIEIETPAAELFTPFPPQDAEGWRTSSNSRH